MLTAAAGSLGLMLAAFAFQHIGGMAPCKMCIWQRYPHVIAIALGAIALWIPNKAIALLGAIAALTTSAIGFFHAGVEQGWWEGPSTCTSAPIGSLSTDELMDQILSAPLVRCDEIPWELFGLSMAAWNGVISLILAGLWIKALTRSF
jgi:disulfide bond formation protein DsbB